MEQNPLLELVDNPYAGHIPFNHIQSVHFAEAFQAAFVVARKNVQAIIDNKDVPTFENTIEAIEQCSQGLDVIASIFTNLKEANTDEELERVAKIVLPQLAEWANDLTLNDVLFSRVKAVYDSKPTLTTKEQYKLLEVVYKSFTRKGALLSADDKTKLRALDQELALLSEKFAGNILGSTNAYQMIIHDEDDLAGIPERVREAAKSEAEKSGYTDAWLFTTRDPSCRPLLKYAEKESVRQEMWLALRTRGMTAEFNNQPVVLEIVTKRHERAVLLGYKSHAAYVLEERMAKTVDVVYSFLDTLGTAAKTKMVEDKKLLEVYKNDVLKNDQALAPWDLSFVADKVRKERYDLDEEEVRNYFELEHAMQAMFEHATRLYGFTFKRRDDIPVFHPDVFAYEVLTSDHKNAGILYFDLFPRESKRAGGWIDAVRVQHKHGDVNIRPDLLIVCNLTKPADGMPVLFTKSELSILFHEFGHALHSLSSNCTYALLASPNTAWDFVEFPSMFMQSFLNDKQSLKMVGQHYETKEIIPDTLIDKMVASNNFLSSFEMLAFVQFSTIDMKFHDIGAEQAIDVQKFEVQAADKYQTFAHYPGTSIATAFKHVFDGGYDAGYYSYRWAEVLAADAFEYFQQNGLLNLQLGKSLQDNVLSKGGSEDPMELYVAFRGKEPDPTALLRSVGLQ